jgi:ACR3 family arsenite transporter
LREVRSVRETLEEQQIAVYFAAVAVGVLVALMLPGAGALEAAINPALALMLFVTFLQVPLAELRQALANLRFLTALLAANFVVIPLIVGILFQLVPDSPLIQFGVLLVLLTPCIDYVVTFAYLGRADARLLLAATPALLIVQMLLLPGYLHLFLGESATGLVRAGPFVHAFLWIIALPLMLAGLVQLGAARVAAVRRAAEVLGVFPVPATALVLFVVVTAVVPRLGEAAGAAARVVPVYIAFAIVAPLIGWMIALLFRLDAPGGRAVAFSAGTRNSLVVLPLAFAVPDGLPLVPAIVVTQTLIELLSELGYVRFIARLGRPQEGLA